MASTEPHHERRQLGLWTLDIRKDAPAGNISIIELFAGNVQGAIVDFSCLVYPGRKNPLIVTSVSAAGTDLPSHRARERVSVTLKVDDNPVRSYSAEYVALGRVAFPPDQPPTETLKDMDSGHWLRVSQDGADGLIEIGGYSQAFDVFFSACSALRR